MEDAARWGHPAPRAHALNNLEEPNINPAAGGAAAAAVEDDSFSFLRPIPKDSNGKEDPTLGLSKLGHLRSLELGKDLGLGYSRFLINLQEAFWARHVAYRRAEEDGEGDPGLISDSSSTAATGTARIRRSPRRRSISIRAPTAASA